jgi:rhamnogalacturonan endolyase
MLSKSLALLLSLAACVLAAGDGFVAVRGGAFRSAGVEVRIEPFDLLDHTVTNAEYREFISATKHAAPLHWPAGVIPAGLENAPVVFVNRYDVADYIRWRSARDRRVYRLPSPAEFEWAARAGAKDALYPWGTAPPAGKANYDAAGNRKPTEWRKYLKPVKSYPPNAWGLFDMAGNVWQMLWLERDPAGMDYVYRLENPMDKMGYVMGGAWTRGEYYLRSDVRAGISAGIRAPDQGFRLARQPAGATHFERVPRRLAALPSGPGKVFLSWQLLAGDAPGVGFHVYRSVRRDSAGERLTHSPITDSTNFVDTGAPAPGRLCYRVRPVAAGGREGPPSEWAFLAASEKRSGLLAVFEPTPKQGGFTPIFADLDGDGVLDLVARLANGIHEMSRDPGVPVELEAYTSFGRALWRRPLGWHDHSYGNPNNLPVVTYDLDGDDKAEVICRLQEGDRLFLAVLDGMNGRVLRKTPWRTMVTDNSGTSTRVHMSIARLDGRTPAIITQTGLYENEILNAYRADLTPLWEYRSFAETNGSGSHHIDIADVDGDGRDEVFNGTMLLNPDGTLRWAIYRQHPDIVAVKHILPGVKDRQVYYAVENGIHAGAYLVDAKTGRTIWKDNRENDPRWVHAHTGWAADIWAGSPGMEVLTNRDGHLSQDQVLYSATGKILLNPFPPGWRPVNWTGGAARELMSYDGTRLGRFTGQGVEALPGTGPNESGKGRCSMVADLAGDYRDEVVCYGTTKDGGQALFVYTNTEPIHRREVTRTASREYRLWLARNAGGGYPSYFEWEPEP